MTLAKYNVSALIGRNRAYGLGVEDERKKSQTERLTSNNYMQQQQQQQQENHTTITFCHEVHSLIYPETIGGS